MVVIPLLDPLSFPIRVTILKPNNTQVNEKGREIIEQGGLKKLKLLKSKLTIPLREDYIYTIKGMFQKRQIYLCEGKNGGLKWVKPDWETMEFKGEGSMLNWMKKELISSMKRHEIKKAQWEKMIPWAALGLVIFMSALGMGIIYDSLGEMIARFPAGGNVKILVDCAINNATLVAPF